jgi:branched-subunit amino acid transport protein
MLWIGVLGGAAACYALKVAGLSLPSRLLANARVQRIGDLLPVALLATLVVTQTFSTGHHLGVDARLAGVTVGALAQWRGAPFLVVVFVAALTAAALRLVA